MKRGDYHLMNSKLEGIIAEVCARDEIDDGELSTRIGYNQEYLQKKSAAKALPEMKLKDVMILAQIAGRRIRIEEV